MLPSLNFTVTCCPTLTCSTRCMTRAIFRQDHAVATRKNLQGAQCVKLCRQMDEAALLRFLIALHRRAEPLRTVIQQQPLFIYIIDWRLQHPSAFEAVERFSVELYLLLHRLRHALLRGEKIRTQIVLVGRGKLCCIRRRRRTHIGNEIGNRHVRLMPDRAHNRNRGCENRPRHALVVKRPEVLHRAAAAPCDDHIRYLILVRIADGARNLGRGFLSLHAHRQNHDFAQRIALSQNPQHVHDRRARAGGDNGNPVRKRRQRLFVPSVKEPFGGELRLELLKRDI